MAITTTLSTLGSSWLSSASSGLFDFEGGNSLELGAVRKEQTRDGGRSRCAKCLRSEVMLTLWALPCLCWHHVSTGVSLVFFFFFGLLFLFISEPSKEGRGEPCVEGTGDVLKKQCSSLNKQPSPKCLISCIFNEPILKTCGLILGTPRPERRAIFRLPPSTVSGTART